MVPVAGGLCQECRICWCMAPWNAGRVQGARQAPGHVFAGWDSANTLPWHQNRAARALSCLLNEPCCCVPGAGVFVLLEGGGFGCHLLESQGHPKAWDWWRNLTERRAVPHFSPSIFLLRALLCLTPTCHISHPQRLWHCLFGTFFFSSCSHS